MPHFSNILSASHSTMMTCNLTEGHSSLCQVTDKIPSMTHSKPDSELNDPDCFLSTEQSRLDCNVPNETQRCSWNTTVKHLLKSMQTASLLLFPQPQFQTIWWTSTLGNPNYCFHLHMPRKKKKRLLNRLAPQLLRDQTAADQHAVP